MTQEAEHNLSFKGNDGHMGRNIPHSIDLTRLLYLFISPPIYIKDCTLTRTTDSYISHWNNV